MRQKRNACAAFTSVPMLQTRSNYMPMPSGASSRKSLAPFTSRDQALADKDEEQKAQAVMPAPEEKNGARTVAYPGCGFIRSEPHADSQAELPLVVLCARDDQKVSAAAGARRILEMWRVEEIGSIRAELHVEPLGEFERAE